MAVVLRSSSDLVYLPDHGFVGIEGAHRILLQITSRIHRLDISHNLLGPSGTLQLIRGLLFSRSRFNSPNFSSTSDPNFDSSSLWGIREINLGCNAVDDVALDAVMGYAKKDVQLRKVWVQANDIELRHNLDPIINSLNSSRIQTLSLTNNKSLLPTSVSHLFQTLSSPHLHELHLSTCSLGPPACRDIASYLSSTRSRNLEHLELNGNCLGAEGIRDIVDAIESSNFTLKLAGFLANDPRPVMSVNEDGEKVEVERSAEERQAEERALAYQVHHRLPPLLERNRVLTRRVRSAARRIIAPARILLNAQPASPQTTAHRLMSSDLEPIFRLLDLPQEILFHIVRHCSGDPGALSESQFARFRAEAEDRGSLARSRGVKEGERMGMDQEERERAEVERREEWLRRGRWERWELDRLVEEQKLGTKG